MSTNGTESNPEDLRSSLGLVAGLWLATLVGGLAALAVLPDVAPSLAGTLLGTNPKAYWYLSRGSAFVALGLLWISMVLGLLITDKMARSWPGSAAAFSVHEYVSLLGLVFAGFHALILLGDRYINYQLVQILMPFGSTNYHQVWVGLGQIGLYTWALISASFYVRQRIGSKTWKVIHYATFFNFMIAIMHGLAAGTDTTSVWAQTAYWVFGGSVLFLTIYRVIAAAVGRESPGVRASPAPPRPVQPEA
jgi:predicted ferric reductase